MKYPQNVTEMNYGTLHCREADGARQLLLFPEGTNMSHAAKQKSDLYAVENNVAKYKHLLHPRTSGNHAHIWRQKKKIVTDRLCKEISLETKIQNRQRKASF